MTEPGHAVLTIAERVLRDVDNLQQVGDEFANEAMGNCPSRPPLHPGASYVLPEVIRDFMRGYPQVRL